MSCSRYIAASASVSQSLIVRLAVLTGKVVSLMPEKVMALFAVSQREVRLLAFRFKKQDLFRSAARWTPGGFSRVLSKGTRPGGLDQLSKL